MTNAQKKQLVNLQKELGGSLAYPDPLFIWGKHKIGFSWDKFQAANAIKILKARKAEQKC